MLFGTETLETEILRLIHSFLECDFFDFLMPRVTALGNAGIIWIAAGLVLAVTPKYRRGGITLLVGLLLGLIIGNGILKNLLARPRPCHLDGSLPLLISRPKDFSFPSGHTLSSFIAAFILLKTEKRFGIAALILAIMIAFSRLYLYVHFPTDVLAAIALASLICLPTKRLIKK